MDWSKWFHNFWMIIKHRDPEIAEAIVGMAMMWWGVWHTLPLGQIFEFSVFFTQLETIASEEAWGILAMAIGGSMLNAVIVNDLDNRKRMTFASFVIWMSCGSASLAAWEMEPLIFYSFFAVISGWNYYRLWTH